MKLTRRLFFARSGAAALVAPAVIPQATAAERDDGPLFADDVTGTDAFALYAAGDPNWRANARQLCPGRIDRILSHRTPR